MSIQAQVLLALQGLIDALGNYAAVVIGAQPAADGLAMAVSTGRTGAETLSLGGTVTLDVALNAKHASQATALDTLCVIHEALSRMEVLPYTERWQMIAIRSAGAPGFVDHEGGQWLYGSALAVEYAVV